MSKSANGTGTVYKPKHGSKNLRNRQTSHVQFQKIMLTYTDGEHDVYYESNGSKIVPAGFENNSVRYRSASSPFA